MIKEPTLAETNSVIAKRERNSVVRRAEGPKARQCERIAKLKKIVYDFEAKSKKRAARNFKRAGVGSPAEKVTKCHFWSGAGYVRNEVSACRLAKWRPARNVTPASLSTITKTKQSWFGSNVGKMLKRVQHDAEAKSRSYSLIRHPELVSGSHKAWGYTLAEALITLAIIGVIAAVALPIVVTNVQNHVRAEQIRTAKYKFTKATDLMNLNGKIGPYYGTTSDFVDELGNYLKIAKVCDNSHLSDCFGYDEMNLGDGDTFKVANIKTGANMKMPKNDSSDYTSENVGIITLDGTSMILSWNTKCTELNQGQLYGWTTENGKPVSNATSSCVAVVMDINGSGKPNTLNKDIALFNANGIGSNCVIELPSGTCLGAVFSPTPLTYDECEARKGELGIKECCTSEGCLSNGDYWAGAVAQCGGVDKLPTMANLAEIVSMIYVGSPTVDKEEKINITYIPGAATGLGFPEPEFRLWSGEEISAEYSYYRYFGPTYTDWIKKASYRYNSGEMRQGSCLVN